MITNKIYDISAKPTPETLSLPQHQELNVLALALATPTMMCVGDIEKSQEIKKILASKGIDVKVCTYIRDLKKKIKGDELGIIYVSPLKRSEILSVHRNIRQDRKFKNLPFFAVVPDYLSSRKERQFYKLGIRMIFEWPQDKKAFGEMISKSLFEGTRKVKSDDTDISLKKAAWNRLKAQYGTLMPKIKIDVYNGVIMARGKVSSLAQKNRLSKRLKAIPGTSGVIDVSVEIETQPIPSKIKRKVETALIASDDIPDKTLRVNFNKTNSTVEIEGSAPSHKVIEHATKRLEKIGGIKRVVSRAIISPRIHEQDLKLAKQAQRIANKLSLGRSKVQIVVKVCQQNATLKGLTNDEMILSQIEQKISELPGIRHIDNQAITTQ